MSNVRTTPKAECYPEWQCVNCKEKITNPDGPCPHCRTRKFVRYKGYQERTV